MSSLLLAAAAAAALPLPSPTAEEVLADAEEQFGVEEPKRRPDPCPESVPGGEIIVCYQFEDPATLRIEPTVTPDRGSPRPPDLFGLPPCTGICVRFGKVPEYPPLIDLKAIPEAPPGSDAARLYGALDEEETVDPAAGEEPASASD